jgi:hypothetical protein
MARFTQLVDSSATSAMIVVAAVMTFVERTMKADRKKQP